MQPIWNKPFIRMPGFAVKEIKQHEDNIYILDEWDRVWQVWLEVEGPMFRLVDRA